MQMVIATPLVSQLRPTAAKPRQVKRTPAMEAIRRGLRMQADLQEHAHVPYISLRLWACGENLHTIHLHAYHDLAREIGIWHAQEQFREQVCEELEARGIPVCYGCGREGRFAERFCPSCVPASCFTCGTESELQRFTLVDDFPSCGDCLGQTFPAVTGRKAAA